MKTAETGLKAKKPVTVVQMVPELESGGVEEETLEVSRFLAEGGHCSMVISGGGRLVSRLRMEGGAHISWPVGRKNPLTLRYLPRLRNLLLNRQADILHIRSRVPAWLGYLTWKTIPRCRRPGLVTSFHGFYSVNRFSAIMAKGEKVIAVSRAVEDHIVRHYGTTRSRIVMIYGGYDEKIFNPALVSGNRIGKLRTRWDLSGNDDPVIMLPGRVTRLKGHDIFFKALKGIDTLAWTAICVGDPGGGSGYVSELEKLAADLGIENRVRFCGLCEDMPAAYALSDIVVSATSFKAESFGKTAVEAQAMGKPVIASAHGGSLETVRDGVTGWLTEPEDADGMAEALREAILNEKLRKQRGENGRKWVRMNFTAARMCTETLKLYENMVS